MKDITGGLVHSKRLMKVSCQHHPHLQLLNGNPVFGAALTFDMHGAGYPPSPGRGLFLRPHWGAGVPRTPNPSAAVSGEPVTWSQPGCLGAWGSSSGSSGAGRGRPLPGGSPSPGNPIPAGLPTERGEGAGGGVLAGKGRPGSQGTGSCGEGESEARAVGAFSWPGPGRVCPQPSAGRGRWPGGRRGGREGVTREPGEKRGGACAGIHFLRRPPGVAIVTRRRRACLPLEAPPPAPPPRSS